MKSIDIEKTFKSIGMKKDGHFLLASGLHSATYFEKFRILEHPEFLVPVCEQIKEKFGSTDFLTVAGPTLGGVVIAYEVAKQFNKRCIFAEKTPEGLAFLRGFKIEKGEKILVVDDVLTTGGSVFKTIDAVNKNGGVVAGVAVLVDRSENPIDFKAPFFAVYKAPTKNYSPDDCPLCKQGIELVKPGGK
ncbi:MAG: orotate phosphoribosyltransferase [bacterium]|nr:orotate phosphoribosyltransferase [bacterium]